MSAASRRAPLTAERWMSLSSSVVYVSVVYVSVVSASLALTSPLRAEGAPRPPTYIDAPVSSGELSSELSSELFSLSSRQGDAGPLQQRLWSRCHQGGWRGLRATLLLSLAYPHDDLTRCQRRERRWRPDSPEIHHRWAVAMRAINAQRGDLALKLLAPLKLSRGLEVKTLDDARLTSEPRHGAVEERWRPWAELSPGLSRYGWLSAEHVDPDQSLIARWSLPASSRGGHLAIGYRGEVKVSLGGELLAALPKRETLWIDQSIIELPPAHQKGEPKAARQVTVELSSGGQLVARWIPTPRSARRASTREPPQALWDRWITHNEHPERLSDEALSALGLYARLSGVHHSRISTPILEGHRRWHQRPTLETALLFWAISPPEIHGQIWSDYPLERAHTPARAHLADAELAQRLLLWRALSHLDHQRIREATLDLQRAAARAELGSAFEVERQLLDVELNLKLGLPHQALNLLTQSLPQSPPQSPSQSSSQSPSQSPSSSLYAQDARAILTHRGVLNQLEVSASVESSDALFSQLIERRPDRGYTRSALQLLLNLTVERARALALDRSGRLTLSASTRRALSVLSEGPQGHSLWSALSLEVIAHLGVEGAEPRVAARELVSALIEVAPIRGGSLYDQLRESLKPPARSTRPSQASSRALLGGQGLISALEARARALIADPQPTRDLISLYHHTHYHLVQGRVTRTERRVLAPLSDAGARLALERGVTYSAGGQRFTLTRAQHLRLAPQGGVSAQRPPTRSARELSRPEDRLFYDLVDERIRFEDLRPGDLIDLQWSISDQLPDPQNERLHADFVYLGSGVERSCVLVSMSRRAREMLDTSIHLQGLDARRDDSTPDSTPESTPDSAPDSAPDSTLCVPREVLFSSSSLLSEGDDQVTLSLSDLPRFYQRRYGPRGTSLVPYVHLSNLRNWSTLARLYGELLRPLVGPSALISETARVWTRDVQALGTQPNQAERARYEREVIEALYRSLTTSVRYLGLELGHHTYFPAHPQTTLSRKAGDCKDRATLMVSLAAKLGVPLEFVLVRTRNSGRLESAEVASLGSFDHAIIYSPTLKRYLDPTITDADPWALPIPDQGAQALHIPHARSQQGQAQGQVSNRLVDIPSPPPRAQGERWTVELNASGLWSLRGELRGDVATQARRELRASERPEEWDTLRAHLPTLAQLDQRLRPNEIKLDLAQRDPLSVSLTLSLDRSAQAELKTIMPPLNLSERLSLATSSLPSAMLLPAHHQAQCINASGLITSADLTRIKGELQAVEPTSPSPDLSASITRERDTLCVSVMIQASRVSREAYPQLRHWINEVEHRLDLNTHLRSILSRPERAR